jgi:hypothetical protein
MGRTLRLVFVPVVLLVLSSSRAGEAAKGKVLNLAACPAWGSERQGSSRAVLNEVKHHLPRDSSPVLLDFADMTVLQRQADALVKSGTEAKVTAKDRAKLRDLAVGAKHVSEGDPVGMVGFVVGRASANPGESANCYLRGASNNDFEFTITAAPKGSPYDGIIGEMIPQDRPKAWTLGRIHKVSADGRQVLVVGQLMFDTRHLPNPKRGTNHESPRVSTWEIHPVTKFLVCQRPDNGCDPSHEDQWQPLASMPDR